MDSRGLNPLLAVLTLLGAMSVWPVDAVQQVFRSSVDVVRLDVRVLDKRTRVPITGLTQSDFTVKVAGQIQPIVAVDEFRSSTGASESSPSDVSANARRGPRLIAIVMDDISVPTTPYHMSKARQVANSVIDELEPNDLAAVIFSQDNRYAQDFTDNRDLLRAAVGHYRSWPVGIGCELPSAMILGTVRRTVEFLSSNAPERAAVLLVSYAPPRCGKEYFIDWSRGALVGRSAATTGGPTQNHVTVPIHAVTVAGLEPPVEGQLLKLPPAGGAMEDLALNSGGRLVRSSNAPEREVEGIFTEMSAYYQLGYTPTFPLDGAQRWLEISVNRPEAVVVPASRPFRSPTAEASVRRDVVPDRLTEAVAAALPNGSLPLRLATTVVQASTSAVAITTLGIDLSGIEAVDRVQLRIDTRLFEGEGRREVATDRREAAVTLTPGAESRLYELVSRYDLRPGRYAMRVAVEATGTDLVGGVFTTVVMPDFARDTLSLSGVAVGRAEGRAVGGRGAVEGVLPFAPTTVREFLRTEHVGALVTVHQAAGRQPAPVTLHTRLRREDGGGDDVRAETRVIPAEAFAGGRGVPHPFEVPLWSLEPGRYRLVFDAVADGRRATRDVLFVVR